MTERIEYVVTERGSAQTAGNFQKVSGSLGTMNANSLTAGQRFSALGTAAGGLGTALGQVNPQVASLTGVLGSAAGAAGSLTEALGTAAVGAAGAGLIGAIGVFALTQKALGEQLKRRTGEIEEQSEGLKKLAESYRKAAAEIQKFAQAGNDADALLGIEARLRGDVEGTPGALPAQERRRLETLRRLLQGRAQVSEEEAQRLADRRALGLGAEVDRGPFEPERGSGSGRRGPSRDLGQQNQDRIRALTELEKAAVNERLENEIEAERDASRVREQIAEHDLRVRQENQDKIIRDATQANEELIELDKEATRRRIQNQELYRAAATSAFGAVGSIAGQTAAAVIQGEQLVIKELLASIGSQMAAHGASLTFQGLGRVISSYGADASGYGLIKTGVAEAAIGIGLGGISVGLAGGSGGSGAASQSTTLTNPRAFASASGGGGGGNSGPTIINFQSPLRPSARDAETIKRIMEQDSRKNGSR